jgi:branched-chain amino acid transport system substrate-binding protein
MHASSKQAILASSCVVFGLIGPLIFWLSNQGGQDSQKAKTSVAQADSSESWSWNLPRILFSGLTNANKTPSMEKRLSLGERVLVTLDDSPEKEVGTQNFQSGKYEEAIARFNFALTLNHNDPESLIYANNAAAHGNAVKIAVVVPVGNNVNVAKEILRGVAQYQYEVNNGDRIQGKFLQVMIANDDNDPEIAKQLATKLAEDPSILAVIGHQSSNVSIAAAPIYERNSLVMMSPTSYARELSGIGKFIFRTTPSSRTFADTLAKHAIQVERNTKFAICSDSKSRASQSFKEDFTAAIYAEGGQVTRTACDFSAPDFNPEEIPSRATSDGATSLLLSPAVEQLKQAIAVMRANKGRLSLLASHSMYTYETLQKGLEASNGLIMTVPWDPSSPTDSVYARNAKKFWGGPGSWRTAMAYDATKAISAGLHVGLSRQKLQESLSNPGFSIKGVTGPLQFSLTGDRNKVGALVKVLPGKKSGTGFDFVTLQRTQSKPTESLNPSQTSTPTEIK